MAARVLLVSQNLKGSELAESLTKEHNLVLKYAPRLAPNSIRFPKSRLACLFLDVYLHQPSEQTINTLGAFLTSNPKNLLVATLTSRKQKQIQELVMLLQLRKACRDLCAIRKQLPYIYSMEYRLPGCNIALANSSKTAAAAVINEAELLKPEIAARVASFLQAKYAAQEHASVLLDPGFYEPFASREVLPLLQGYLGSIANIASASDEELSRVGYYLA